MKNSVPARLIRRGIVVSLLVVVLAGPALAGHIATADAPPSTAAGGHIETPIAFEALAAGGETLTTNGVIHNPLLSLILSLLGVALLYAGATPRPPTETASRADGQRVAYAGPTRRLCPGQEWGARGLPILWRRRRASRSTRAGAGALRFHPGRT